MTPRMEGAEGNQNLVGRLEQIWWALNELFEDLIRRDIDARIVRSYARELRNCRTMINFVRSHACPTCEERIDDKLQDLQRDLEKIKRDLISAALSVDEDYAKGWMNKIDRVERGKLDHPITQFSARFVPGLHPRRGWTRLTLPRPIAKEEVRDFSERLGVAIEFEDSLHIIVRGKEASVKKAVQIIWVSTSEVPPQGGLST